MIIETQKANPHMIVSASRLSKKQQKDDVDALVVCERGRFILPVSELKYTANKFGKKIVDDEKLGQGYYFEISATDEEDEPLTELKPKKVKQEIFLEEKPIKEELIVKNDRKIHLSRLDLFEDED